MKRGLKHRGRYVVLKGIDMSHASAGGEYEISVSGAADLDTDNMCRNLKNAGYQVEEVKPGSVTLLHSGAMITVLRVGRILIQDLLPDTIEEALRIGTQLMNAEQEI